MRANPWLLIAVGGLFEAVWATTMNESAGFTDPFWTAVTYSINLLSVWFLYRGLKTGMPMGGAYAVWAGCGTVVSTAFGYLFYGQALAPLEFLFLAVLVAGILLLQYAEGPDGRGTRHRSSQKLLPALPRAATFASGEEMGVSHPGASMYPPSVPAAAMRRYASRVIPSGVPIMMCFTGSMFPMIARSLPAASLASPMSTAWSKLKQSAPVALISGKIPVVLPQMCRNAGTPHSPFTLEIESSMAKAEYSPNMSGAMRSVDEVGSATHMRVAPDLTICTC